VRIFLNNEQLDVTLENETNLGEVYQSLRNWMGKAGLHPLALTVDGTEKEISDFSDWGSTGIAEVESFGLTAGTVNQLRANQLMTTLDYLNLLIQILNRSGAGERLADEYQGAVAEYGHIRSALPQLMSITDEAFSEDFSLLDAAAAKVSAAGNDPAGIAPAVLEEFRTRLEQVRVLLIDRLQEVTRPKAELRAIAALLSALAPELEEAGISLQTGREREAYNLVFRVSEMTAKLVRVIDCASVEDPGLIGDELKDMVGRVGEVVTRVNETISAEDQVLLADLLEYDLREIIEELTGAIGVLELGDE
jgi:hypothetical protein